MSAELIKENISRILEERGWKLQDLEKKAGTNRNIHNIFRNKSNNPSVELIQKVATTLNVDLKELINDHSSKRYIHDYKLFLEACQKIIVAINKLPEKIEISYEAMLFLVYEVCLYANQFKHTSIDDQFVEWTVTKYYSSDLT